jgi:hypothetical protein
MRAAHELKHYDFDAVSKHHEYDVRHAGDHLPRFSWIRAC